MSAAVAIKNGSMRRIPTSKPDGQEPKYRELYMEVTDSKPAHYHGPPFLCNSCFHDSQAHALLSSMNKSRFQIPALPKKIQFYRPRDV
jgi:hypothetical protein